MDFGCINKTNELQLTCSEACIWGGEDGRDKRKRKSRNEEGNLNAVVLFWFGFKGMFASAGRLYLAGPGLLFRLFFILG